MKYKIIYILYLIVTVSALLAVVEYCAGKIIAMKEANVDIAKGNFFDPHLGYANADTGPKVATLEHRGHKFIQGFAVYHHRSSSLSDLSKPTILVLGGSTSQPFIEPKSWPEYLSDIMRDKGQNGQVINGAVAGYTSSQELIKLVRDGLELHPNIIISYGGLRDREDISPLPFPMVPMYQRNVAKSLAKNKAPLMPNTISLVLGTYNRGYTFGLPTKNNHAQAWMRNMRVMDTIAKEFDAGFCAIMQPFPTEETVGNTGVRRHSSYLLTRKAQITESHGSYFVVDMTNILDQLDGIYEKGPYANDNGNRVIAERVYRLIFDEKRCWPNSN